MATRRSRETTPRARLAVLFVALVAMPTLSGCISIDFFLPQPEEKVAKPDGLVRVWAAAKPGGLGPEFSHYNITFSFAGIAQDIFFDEIMPLKVESRTVDLVRLEEDEQALPLGSIAARPGSYFGVALATSKATLGISRIVGDDGGEPVTRVEETDASVKLDEHGRASAIQLRSGFEVVETVVTDLFVEIDLRKSLVREDDGSFRHATIPDGISIYIQGKKVGEDRYDGGAKELGLDGSVVDRYGSRWEDADQYAKPWARLVVEDPVEDKQIYSAQRSPTHRMLRAAGLGEDLRFDARRSISNAGTGDHGRADIVAWDWDFGDGVARTGAEVLHNWTTGGIHTVTLTVRDSLDLVGRQHMSLFVPYTAEEAERIERDARSGTLLLGSQLVPLENDLDSGTHTITLPQDLDDGALRLGGYRVSVDFADPAGGLTAALTEMEVSAQSGHLDTTVRGTSPLVMETAAIPVWRGPLIPWVDDSILIDVTLATGAVVDYDIEVEGLYYANLSRGFDTHAVHLHDAWPFGPDFSHLDHEGRRIETES